MVGETGGLAGAGEQRERIRKLLFVLHANPPTHHIDAQCRADEEILAISYPHAVPWLSRGQAMGALPDAGKFFQNERRERGKSVNKSEVGPLQADKQKGTYILQKMSFSLCEMIMRSE